MRHTTPLALALAIAGSLMLAGGAAAADIAQPAAPAAATPRLIADHQMEIGNNYAHLRSKPTTHSTKLATLKKGTRVDVLEMVENGKWAHVRVNGKDGYISANLLK
jgi:uncharacterized protein YgiM (DUF1202 family)